MTLYCFYPCTTDGGSTVFETFEAASDREARAIARRVLTQHESCAYVTVWDGERAVLSEHRHVASVHHDHA